MKNKFFFSSMLVSLLAFCLCFTSCGPSAAEIAIRSAPSVGEVKGLKDKLTWLEGNAQSGGNYILEIDTDEKIGVGFLSALEGFLSYKDRSNITITLRGVGANRTISRKEFGSIFTVGSGVTLILDDNITLRGLDFSSVPTFELTKTDPLVKVSSGGTLIMNDGSTITGNANYNNYGNGGGVYVNDGGTFIMKGGTIAKNQARSIKPNFDKSTKKEIVYDASSAGHGGGVYVHTSNGTFIKTGGTITGYSSDPTNGNVVVAPDGSGVINGCGHAVFFAGYEYIGYGLSKAVKEPKAIDNTVGPEYSFHYSNGTFKETQNEPKPQKALTQPDNNNPESSANSSPEIQETVQQVPQQVPQKPAVTQQEALQEYQAAAQKMQATQREALQEYQATIQKNPAAQQEAVQKYQKALQEAQQELQEATKKYQETMQNKR